MLTIFEEFAIFLNHRILSGKWVDMLRIIHQMPVGEFAVWFAGNGETLLSKLYNGTYEPQGVKQVEIPKPNGGKRKLGIPTVTDRIIQQAIAQVLSPIYERKFSDHSYGFRPNRSAHKALKKGSEYVAQGRCIVVDMDLKTFFDVVNHDCSCFPHFFATLSST